MYLCLFQERVKLFLDYNSIKYNIPEIGVSNISYHKRSRKANYAIFLSPVWYIDFDLVYYYGVLERAE